MWFLKQRKECLQQLSRDTLIRQMFLSAPALERYMRHNVPRRVADNLIPLVSGMTLSLRLYMKVDLPEQLCERFARDVVAVYSNRMPLLKTQDTVGLSVAGRLAELGRECGMGQTAKRKWAAWLNAEHACVRSISFEE